MVVPWDNRVDLLNESAASKPWGFSPDGGIAALSVLPLLARLLLWELDLRGDVLLVRHLDVDLLLLVLVLLVLGFQLLQVDLRAPLLRDHLGVVGDLDHYLLVGFFL